MHVDKMSHDSSSSDAHVRTWPKMGFEINTNPLQNFIPKIGNSTPTENPPVGILKMQNNSCLYSTTITRGYLKAHNLPDLQNDKKPLQKRPLRKVHPDDHNKTKEPICVG